jgi:phage host-nuclease inhibitor protein Gam
MTRTISEIQGDIDRLKRTADMVNTRQGGRDYSKKRRALQAELEAAQKEQAGTCKRNRKEGTMSKADVTAKLQERVDYLLRHCDSDDETEIVEWMAGHVAEALGVDLTVRGYTIGATRGA